MNERVTRYIRLVIDASGAKSGGNDVKKALNEINRSVKRTAASFDNLKRIGLAALGGLGAREIWRAVVGGAANAERQFFRLQGLINATGASAGKTVQDIAGISREIGRATLASTQEVRDAAGSLLTFKSIGGDAFDDVLRRAQDLAEAGFGNLRTNTQQLGKALEDPVRGLSQLRRVGVSFTAAQEDQIKALARTGQQAEAQRIILKALEEQVGGAGVAAAQGYAGALDTAGEAAKELAEEVGSKLLPVLTTGLNAVTRAIDFLTENSDGLLGAVTALATVGIPLLVKGLGVLKVAVLANPILLLATAAVTAGAAIGKLLGTTLTFGNTSLSVFDLFKTVISDVIGLLSSLLEGAKTFFMGWIEGASGILGASTSSFGGIGDAVKGTVNFAIASGKSLFDAWIGFFRGILEAALGAFRGIASAAGSVGRSVKLALKGEFAAAREELSGAFDGFDFSGVSDSVSASAKTIGENFGRDFVGEAGGKITDFLDNTIGQYADSVVKRTIDNVTTSPSDQATAIIAPDVDLTGGKTGGSRSGSRGKKSAGDEIKSLKDQLLDLGESAKSTADVMSESIGNAIGSLTDGFVEFARTGKANFRELFADLFANLAKLALNSAFKQLVGGFAGGGGFGLGSLLGIPGFAQGGDFTVGGGGGTDSKLVQFRASPGERVSVRRPDQQDAAPAAPKIVNVLDPSIVGDYLRTDDGERLILNVMNKGGA